MDNDEDYEVGYGKPPKHSRFRKGVSGNPSGRPRKEKPATDLRAMLERVSREEIEIAGVTVTMQELELMAIQRKAAKGDIPASRHLASLREKAGCYQADNSGTGVLVVPGTMPLDQWTAAAAIQQAKFRTKIDGEE